MEVAVEVMVMGWKIVFVEYRAIKCFRERYKDDLRRKVGWWQRGV